MALLYMSEKEGLLGLVGELGVLIFGFKGVLWGRGGSGVQGERAERLSISSSCLSSGDILIKILMVAASCGLMEVSLSSFIVSR